MNTKVFLNIFGTLIKILGLLMLIPCVVAIIYGEASSVIAFAIPALLTLAIGIYLERRGIVEVLGNREGFALVAFGWLGAAFFGSLPYIFLGMNPIDALFESMSGFTTTGATILTEFNEQGYWIINATAADKSLASNLAGLILGNTSLAANESIMNNITNNTLATGPSTREVTYNGLLFWRSFTQWLGGMGIILLFIAILPKLGVAGRQLFKAEVPGPTEDMIRPRIRETAKLLWYVYVVLTAVEILLLKAAGMPLYDSICNTFSTMACGGFSPRAESIAFYNSSLLESIIIIFMFLAGANFALHYRTMYSDRAKLINDPEFRFYSLLILLATSMVLIFGNMGGESAFESIRMATFQVVSIITTTGFATANYNDWSSTAKLVLVMLAFIGGCAGSTAGGIKVVRILLLLRYAHRELLQALHPKAIMAIKLGDRPVKEDILRSILIFFALYLIIFGLASVMLASLDTIYGEEMDIVSTTSAVVATLGNVGPGLEDVGPTADYADICPLGKLILVACMWIGRLEILTVLILLVPDFWKR